MEGLSTHFLQVNASAAATSTIIWLLEEGPKPLLPILQSSSIHAHAHKSIIHFGLHGGFSPARMPLACAPRACHPAMLVDLSCQSILGARCCCLPGACMSIETASLLCDPVVLDWRCGCPQIMWPMTTSSLCRGCSGPSSTMNHSCHTSTLLTIPPHHSPLLSTQSTTSITTRNCTAHSCTTARGALLHVYHPLPPVTHTSEHNSAEHDLRGVTVAAAPCLALQPQHE